MIANKALVADREKRMYERYNCEAIIKWSYFNGPITNNKAKVF